MNYWSDAFLRPKDHCIFPTRAKDSAEPSADDARPLFQAVCEDGNRIKRTRSERGLVRRRIRAEQLAGLMSLAVSYAMASVIRK